MKDKNRTKQIIQRFKNAIPEIKILLDKQQIEYARKKNKSVFECTAHKLFKMKMEEGGNTEK